MKHLHSERNHDLRRRLRDAREKAGQTQAGLALALGRHQSFVSKYETGERRLDVLEFADVCNELGIDPVHLLACVLGKR